MGHVSLILPLAILLAAVGISRSARITSHISENQMHQEFDAAEVSVVEAAEPEKPELGPEGNKKEERKPDVISSPALDLNLLHTAFDSIEGLTLRVADPSERSRSETVSASVWRSDLPIALHKGTSDDSAGIIFVPGSTHALCAYPNNALTDGRVNGHGQKDQCGESYQKGHDMSGQCNFTTRDEFVSAYYNKPKSHKYGWDYPFAVCHFTEVPEMLDVQKKMLNQCADTPPDLDAPPAIIRAIWLNSVKFAMTAFNEVVIAPHDARSVGGIFWAHSGPFREPQRSDSQAWNIAQFLSLGANTLPIFEFAGVALAGMKDPPFGPCDQDIHNPKPEALDCLSQGMDEWRANLTAGGGRRNASSVFRALSDTVFLKLLPGTKVTS